MDTNLLLKEQEYLEINKRLDKRTQELLHKIDNFKKTDIDDIFKGNSISDTQFVLTAQSTEREELPQLPRSKSACNPSIAKFTPEELKALNVPEDINNVGAKGFVQFLKSKAKQLQFDLDRISKDHREKCEEVKKLQKDKVKLQEDKEKFLQHGNIARCQITKLEAQLAVSQSKLQAKEGEYSSLVKEVDGLNRELKSTKSNVQNGEVRYQRVLEELSKLKASLRSMQQNEKDLKNAHRKHSNALGDTIKRLEKQKVELLAGFKKQHALIDNLKQQKIHIEAAKFADKTEADFIKIMSEGDTYP